MGVDGGYFSANLNVYITFIFLENSSRNISQNIFCTVVTWISLHINEAFCRKCRRALFAHKITGQKSDISALQCYRRIVPLLD